MSPVTLEEPRRSEPLRFPTEAVHLLGVETDSSERPPRPTSILELVHTVRTVRNVSRRIDDLARQLNCLGYFEDDDDDRPRAA